MPLLLRQPLVVTVPERPPKVRGECCAVQRPCLFVGCAYNNYLSVRKGQIEFTWGPGVEPEDVPEDASCALDVAEQGGVVLEDLAALFVRPAEDLREEVDRALNQVRYHLARTGKSQEFWQHLE